MSQSRPTPATEQAIIEAFNGRNVQALAQQHRLPQLAIYRIIKADFIAKQLAHSELIKAVDWVLLHPDTYQSAPAHQRDALIQRLLRAQAFGVVQQLESLHSSRPQSGEDAPGLGHTARRSWLRSCIRPLLAALQRLMLASFQPRFGISLAFRSLFNLQ